MKVDFFSLNSLIIFVIVFASVLLANLATWVAGRFKLSEPYSVFFTLDSLTGGMDSSIKKEGFQVTFGSLALSFAITSTFVFLLQYFCISPLTIYIFISLFPIISIVYAWKILYFWDFLKVKINYAGKYFESSFYKKEYVEPSGKVTFPQQKRNCLMIFLESMESSYQGENEGGFFKDNLLPGLTVESQKSDAVNFSNNGRIGGGRDVAGTNWTIAAMTSKLLGIPYSFTVKEMDSLSEGGFLPNITGLNDILQAEGYNQTFLFGTDKAFAYRDTLLETHGNLKILDLNHYKGLNLVEKEAESAWGFDDAKLYELAKMELTELGKSDKPWFLGFLTVDLHMPYGFPSHDMVTYFTDPKNEKKARMKNIVLDSDKKISTFLAWCRKQPWYDNTTIVLYGDHTFMETSKTSFFDLKPTDEQRFWFNLFVNAPSEVVSSGNFSKNRKFSSLDMMPTVLRSLGCSIEGNRLALGADLFSGEKTLLERYSFQELNTELMKKNTTYKEFLMAKK